MSEKREFDRHSGSNKTGVKAIDKREGSGAHNWGSVRDEAEAAIKETHGGKPVGDVQDDEPKQQEAMAPGGEMTLQEYLQKEEAKRLHPHFNTRQPNEDVKN